MRNDEDDIREHVFQLTYQGLREDAMASSSWLGRHAPAAPTGRFSSHLALEKIRDRIHHSCVKAGTEAGLTEYLTTRWLDRFRPWAM